VRTSESFLTLCAELDGDLDLSEEKRKRERGRKRTG
jgi:hypothetical protein